MKEIFKALDLISKALEDTGCVLNCEYTEEETMELTLTNPQTKERQVLKSVEDWEASVDSIDLVEKKQQLQKWIED